MKVTTAALRSRRSQILARCERSGTTETLTHAEREELNNIDDVLAERAEKFRKAIVLGFSGLPGAQVIGGHR